MEMCRQLLASSTKLVISRRVKDGKHCVMQRKRQGQLLINVVILGTAAPVSHVYGNVGRISLRKDRGFQE